jgi:hypothetical protein
MKEEAGSVVLTINYLIAHEQKQKVAYLLILLFVKIANVHFLKNERSLCNCAELPILVFRRVLLFSGLGS